MNASNRNHRQKRLLVVSKITSANGIPRTCRPSSSKHVDATGAVALQARIAAKEGSKLRSILRFKVRFPE